ncbi:hypothetical protein TNCT_685471 [Trichonephila clavata]|uniref:Uncharacterized protein n=1 Tax=Trichonephila clavata TaxID=2740835 RepID=A0A8X6HRL9_TRICU|nr:hypothetical protein TNCT_685471 [Trichonephila clavata]
MFEEAGIEFEFTAKLATFDKSPSKAIQMTIQLSKGYLKGNKLTSKSSCELSSCYIKREKVAMHPFSCTIRVFQKRLPTVQIYTQSGSGHMVSIVSLGFLK